MAETLDFHRDGVVGTVKPTHRTSSLVAIVVIHDISISSDRGWLSTFLPTDLPLAHIWKLRYDASLADTFDRFLVLSDRLLEALNRISQAYEEAVQYIVLVGHGLGGFLLKQALLSEDVSVKSSKPKVTVKGILLLDCRYQTSHQKLLKLARHDPGGEDSHHNQLVAGLQVVQQNFEVLWRRSYFEVVSFTSTLSISVPSTCWHSALYQQDQPAIPLPTTHEGLLQSSSKDSSYRLLLAQLQRLSPVTLCHPHDLEDTTRQAFEGYLQALDCDTREFQARRPSTVNCSWIFDNQVFADWLKPRNSSHPFWICGKPGSGKSTLMRYLATSLQQGFGITPLPAFTSTLFYSWNSVNRHDTLNSFLRNILLQLVEQALQKSLDLSTNFLAEVERAMPSNWTNQTEILADHLELLLRDVTRCQPVYILIDELDVLDPQDANQILDFIRPVAYQRRASQVKVLVASRRDDSLQENESRMFMDKANHTGIARYLSDQFEGLSLEHKCHRNTENIVCGEILRKAQGVFLWVELVVRELRYVSEDGEDVLRVLETLSSDLESLYERLLRRTVRSKDDHFPPIVNTLSWILSARRPLSALEIYDMSLDTWSLGQRFLKTPPDGWQLPLSEQCAQKRFIDDLLARSCGLVETFTPDYSFSRHIPQPTKTKMIRLKHASVATFLRCRIQDYLYLDSLLEHEISIQALTKYQLIHLEMAEQLLVYLNFCAGVLDTGKVPLGDIRMAMPLLDYARTFWFQHFEAGDGTALKTHELLALFPSMKNLHVESWASMKSFMPPDIPGWICEEPTMLCVCSYFGFRDLTRCCLERDEAPRGAKVMIDQPNGIGRTPLAIAAAGGHVDIVNTLLNHGADLDVIDRLYGQSILKFAAWAGHDKIVSILLAHGAKVNDILNGTTALSQSCAFGHYEVVQELLRHGASPNQHDIQRGQSPLSLAISNRHAFLVKILVSYGADVNQRDLYTDLTPLHHAIMARSPDIVNILVREGAHADIKALSALPDSQAQWLLRILGTITDPAQQHGFPRRCGNETRGKSDKGAYQNAQSCSDAKQTASTNGKRSRASDQSHGDEQDDGPPNKQLKGGRKPGPAPQAPNNMKFACPYAVKYPEIYGSAKHCGTGYATIPDLKTHLFRYHRNPCCERCGGKGHCGDEGFVGLQADKKLADHDMNGTCNQLLEPSRDLSAGFYRSQAVRLKERHRQSRCDDHEKYKEKWRLFFRILFDLDDNAETPLPYCVGTDQLVRENHRLSFENQYHEAALRRLLIPSIYRNHMSSMNRLYNESIEPSEERVNHRQLSASPAQDMTAMLTNQAQPPLPINLPRDNLGGAGVYIARDRDYYHQEIGNPWIHADSGYVSFQTISNDPLSDDSVNYFENASQTAPMASTSINNSSMASTQPGPIEDFAADEYGWGFDPTASNTHPRMHCTYLQPDNRAHSANNTNSRLHCRTPDES